MKQKILAFITDGVKYLALRNRFHPNHGEDKWFVVTGGVKKGETREEAVRREVNEETNLVVKNILDLNWASIYLWDNKLCFEKNFIAFVENGTIILNEEHIDSEWLNLFDFVRKIKWDLNKEELIEILKKGLKRKILFSEMRIEDFRKL